MLLPCIFTSSWGLHDSLEASGDTHPLSIFKAPTLITIAASSLPVRHEIVVGRAQNEWSRLTRKAGGATDDDEGEAAGCIVRC